MDQKGKSTKFKEMFRNKINIHFNQFFSISSVKGVNVEKGLVDYGKNFPVECSIFCYLSNRMTTCKLTIDFKTGSIVAIRIILIHT